MLKEPIFRTFDELLADVQSDWKSYDQEGFIDPQDLIKVAQFVNKDLSIKINKSKTDILEIIGGKVKLPNDLYLLNFALVCSNREVCQTVVSGIQTEDIMLDTTVCNPAQNRYGRIIKLNECGQEFEVVHYTTSFKHTYKTVEKIHLKAQKEISSICPNRKYQCSKTGYVSNGWLHTNFDSGKLYIEYVSTMEDEDGNLLVLDHDMINKYYEYALKTQILENMLFAGEEVGQLHQMMDEKRRRARIEAKSIAGQYEFDELAQMWELNRKAQYQKYYYQFL